MPYGDGQTCNACLHPVREHDRDNLFVGCRHEDVPATEAAPWPYGRCGCSRTQENAT